MALKLTDVPRTAASAGRTWLWCCDVLRQQHQITKAWLCLSAGRFQLAPPRPHNAALDFEAKARNRLLTHRCTVCIARAPDLREGVRANDCMLQD